ncbi:MAG: Asp-tRNA(Asn)/Glu-tRNA(Gln) amidotransferase subunit GatC [Planctomycetota bacterium]
MSLGDDDVRKLALLARLELTDEEIGSVRPKLTKILGFIEKLSELDTEDVEPMTTAVEVDNHWRVDELGPVLEREQALANAPSSDEECFRVPPVLGPTS